MQLLLGSRMNAAPEESFRYDQSRALMRDNETVT